MDKKIIIIGNSGHAKVVANIILENKKYQIIGCVSNIKEPLIIGNIKIPYIGDDNDLIRIYKKGVKKTIIAIGDNKIRNNLYIKVKNIGYELINAISLKTNIASSVKIGKGVVIMQGASIQPMVVIEDNTIINTNSSIDHDCYIEKSVHIGPGCNLAGNVHIGEGTFLGIGSKVIPKIKIGKWSIIGAGGVVIDNLPDKIIAVGIPAKIIKKNYKFI